MVKDGKLDAEDMADIMFLEAVFNKFDTLVVRLSPIFVLALLLIGLTLFAGGLVFLFESWEVLLKSVGLLNPQINYFPLPWTGDFTTIVIEALGGVAIGYAVIDLSRSLLSEEIAEERILDPQKRARDFVTRILSVIVVALAIETFVNEARFGVTEHANLWQVAAMGMCIAAIMVGWGVYLKLSK